MAVSNRSTAVASAMMMARRMVMGVVYVIGLGFIMLSVTSAFSTTPTLRFRPFRTPSRKTSTSRQSCVTITSSDDISESSIMEGIRSSGLLQLDVVLFGVGDLRTTDHGGLHRALQLQQQQQQQQQQQKKEGGNTNTNKNGDEPISNTIILPLLILDVQDTLPNLPGAVSHTLDSAAMLSEAIVSLSNRLEQDYGLQLCVQTGDTVASCLSRALELQPYPTSDIITCTDTTASSSSSSMIRIHACDLGPADASMGYSPLPHLLQIINNTNTNSKNECILPSNTVIQPWDTHLRQEPWDNLMNLPQKYPTFASQYQSVKVKPLLKTSSSTSISSSSSSSSTRKCNSKIPSEVEILALMEKALELNNNDVNKEDPETTKARLEAELNTGLFGTHWGGLNNGCFTEEDVLTSLQTFVECGGEDTALVQSDWYQQIRHCRNPASLEHASLCWMAGTSPTTTTMKMIDPNVENWIEGEVMTRFLAAPLLYGTVSTRQVWHAGAAAAAAAKKFPWPLGKSKNGLTSLAEGREWHRLFAAQSIQKEQQQQQHSDIISNKVQYKYWRYHGFLCRYGFSTLKKKTETSSSSSKEGLLLVHGFGASGSQFEGLVAELAQQSSKESNHHTMDNEWEALLPDLMGFGQAEKPPLSYTQYFWSAFVSEFARDIALRERNCDSFVVGGNSIGGFTSMSMAADDVVPINTNNPYFSSSGAPGSGKCTGLILMNSAGQIKTEEEVEHMSLDGNVDLATVAEVTAMDRLGKCSPPPRGLTTVGGNGLLWYLRPRIQSICKNLYPTNPSAVNDNLCSGILRDSLDPGAIHVMVSGSKLPAPRTVNELLGADFGSVKSCHGPDNSDKIREGMWEGPVLVAQGFLDPLNDAVGRSKSIGGMRLGITVDPINGGHCPHDEMPGEVATSILKWTLTQRNNINGNNKVHSILEEPVRAMEPSTKPFFVTEL
eukprot:scaffold158261_cov62-Attheya_sp.AAC.2